MFLRWLTKLLMYIPDSEIAQQKTVRIALKRVKPHLKQDQVCNKYDSVLQFVTDGTLSLRKALKK